MTNLWRVVNEFHTRPSQNGSTDHEMVRVEDLYGMKAGIAKSFGEICYSGSLRKDIKKSPDDIPIKWH